MLLLLSKEYPDIPLMSHGIVCTIIADAQTTLRVRIHSTIEWYSKTDYFLEIPAKGYYATDASLSTLIEMGES